MHNIDGTIVVKRVIEELRKRPYTRKEVKGCNLEALEYMHYTIKAYGTLDRLCRCSIALKEGGLHDKSWCDRFPTLEPCANYYGNNVDNLKKADWLVGELEYNFRKASLFARIICPNNMGSYYNLLILAEKIEKCYTDSVIFAPQKEIKELRKMITKSEKYAKKLFLKSGFKYEKVEGMAHFMPEIQSIWDKIHLKKDNRQCEYDLEPYLTYVIKALLYDLQSDAFCKNLDKDYWGGIDYLSKPLFTPIKAYGYDSNTFHTIICIKPTEKPEIDFSKQIVVSSPDSMKKLCDKTNKIDENGFIYDDSNHEINYYTELDFAQVQHGFHSQTIGSMNRSGVSYANVIYRMDELFKRFEIDYSKNGFYWKSTDPKYGVNLSEENRITDPRLALIYEAGRVRWLLRNNTAERNN